MDGIVQGVAKSWTQLSDFHFTLVIKFNIRAEEHRNVSLMRKYDSEHLSNSNLDQDKKTQPPLRDPPTCSQSPPLPPQLIATLICIVIIFLLVFTCFLPM